MVLTIQWYGKGRLYCLLTQVYEIKEEKFECLHIKKKREKSGHLDSKTLDRLVTKNQTLNTKCQSKFVVDVLI